MAPDDQARYDRKVQQSADAWRKFWSKIPALTKERISSSVRGLESVIAPTMIEPSVIQEAPLKTRGIPPPAIC